MHKIHDNHNNGNTSRTEYSKRFISLRNSNNNNKIGCLLLISYWCLRAPVFLLFYLPFFSIFAIISFFKWVLYVQSVVHHSTVGLFYFHVFYRLSVCYAHFFSIFTFDFLFHFDVHCILLKMLTRFPLGRIFDSVELYEVIRLRIMAKCTQYALALKKHL